MDSHEELSNAELVTLAVNNLGGSVNPVNLEDIAVEAFRLAAKRFSWKKYKDRIDLRIVHYSVQSATRPDIGYLKGNATHGYMITETGLKWIAETEGLEIVTKSSRKRSTSDIVAKEKERLLKTSAYRKFIEGDKEQINNIDFREFTRVNDYFPKEIKEQKYAKIQNITDEDDMLRKVWDFLKINFVYKE